MHYLSTKYDKKTYSVHIEISSYIQSFSSHDSFKFV